MMETNACVEVAVSGLEKGCHLEVLVARCLLLVGVGAHICEVEDVVLWNVSLPSGGALVFETLLFLSMLRMGRGGLYTRECRLGVASHIRLSHFLAAGEVLETCKHGGKCTKGMSVMHVVLQ